MKTKIITVLLSLTVFISTLTLALSIPVTVGENRVPDPNVETLGQEVITTPEPEQFTVKSQGETLTVYDSDGRVLVEVLAPSDVPELEELTEGVVLDSREAMLEFMEDFEE